MLYEFCKLKTSLCVNQGKGAAKSGPKDFNRICDML